MSKNIVNGVLVEMSPSMIVAFDASTSFGCEQRAVFRYMMGLEDPPSGNQQLGTDLHALAEERLLTGKTPSGEGEAFGLYLAGQAMIEQVASRKILKVEQPIPTFYISGVKVKGYNDVVTADGIVDWKTSSDIRRYGKTAGELAHDTAMVIYGKAEHPTLATVKLAHGQFQTKGRKTTDFVEVEVTQEHLDAHIEKVIVPKVERMKVLAADPEQAVRDFKKCFNCTFRPRCPTPGAETVMGFFTKVINKDTASVSAGSLLNDGSFAVKSDATVTHLTDEQAKKIDAEVAKVTPPDAPASDPAKAADPVAGFDPLPPKKSMKIIDVPADTKEVMVEAMTKAEPSLTAEQITTAKANDEMVAKDKEETKKRGRPPGAKNKPKEEPESVRRAEMDLEQVRPAERKFKSQTYTFGATINVGNYSNVHFEWSITSDEHTEEEIREEVMRRIETQAAKYEAEIAKDKKVNGKEIVK